jgi:hypothetical protein
MCQRETALVLTLKNTLPAVFPEKAAGKAEKPEKKDKQQTFIQPYF